MTDANNVIGFPKIGNPPPRNETELGYYFDENKKMYIDHVVDHYSTQLINKLGLHGFGIYEPEFIQNYSFTVETLRSCLYQSIDLYHPFKEYIDQICEELDDEDFDEDIY